MSSITGATEATGKTPGGVARATPRRDSPARVHSSVNTPTAFEELLAKGTRRPMKKSSRPSPQLPTACRSSSLLSPSGTKTRGCLDLSRAACLRPSLERTCVDPITIDALGPLEEKPAAPRACASWPDDDKSMFASLAPPRGQPSAQHRMPERAAKPMIASRQEEPPHATHTVAAIGSYGMPTASQRNLNIRKFDGMDLYKGLESGFFDWGRTFMRSVSLAEASCGFTWTEDAKVDLLGHFLAAITNRSTLGGLSNRDLSM
uniref:RxLR effector candidate protein n=1 Tax=Hyaloperonospora arabidopsidis (strain Emoy2) TaxID=559515 RepID=M4BSZ8_HYAAE